MFDSKNLTQLEKSIFILLHRGCVSSAVVHYPRSLEGLCCTQEQQEYKFPSPGIFMAAREKPEEESCFSRT